MTSYILCGGKDRTHDHYGKNLAQTISNLSNDKPKILSVLFAEPVEKWNHYKREYSKFFDKHFPEIPHEFADFNDFRQQVARNNVIYFHGGSAALLMESLREVRDELPELFQNKIIVGSSAGAVFLSNFCLFDKDDTKVHQGFGILPINAVVHFGSADPRFERPLSDVQNLVKSAPEYPTILLREGEFTIFEYGGKE